jgi:hypothetical protein
MISQITANMARKKTTISSTITIKKKHCLVASPSLLQKSILTGVRSFEALVIGCRFEKRP